MNEQFEYRQELDSLHFTPEQKTQIAARAAQAAAEATAVPAKRTRRRPIVRTALIAACLAAMLAVGAGATGVLRPVADVFGPIFGGSAAQTEVIDKIGYPIGASDTDNGITITADAIIGDAYNACVVFTVTREDGEIFDFEGNEYGYLPLMFWNASVDIGRINSGHGGSYFIDQVPGDNAIQYVETFSSTEGPLRTSTGRTVFEDLYVWDEENEELKPLVKGKWKLNFNVAYEDTSVSLANGETFAQDGMTFTIDELTISPVAYRLAYTVDREVVWSDAPSGQQSDADQEQWETYFTNVEILLTMTDGTVVDISSTGGSIESVDGTTVCVKGNLLDQIIPLEELSSISVGGVVYPIHAE